MPKTIINEIILTSGATVAALPTPDTAPRTNEHYESFTGQPMPDGSPTSQDEHALVVARTGRGGNEFVETLTDGEFLELYSLMTRMHPRIAHRMQEKAQLTAEWERKEEVDARFGNLSNRDYGYTQQ